MFQDLESVHFSELIGHNVDTGAIFSPNGLMIACASECQALIWDVDSKEILHKFICDHPIDCLVWSPNSELIYCSALKQNTIQIWNLANPTRRCKIEETPLAIADIVWAPDSEHLLVVSEFHIKITVWSLVSRTITVIENPKAIKDCVAFSSCSRYMAVVEKKKSEDFIRIYTCDTWEILKCFPIESNDVAGIYFSPLELVIGVLETATEKNKILFYCVDGRLLGKYSNVCSSLFSWSPNGKFIAVGDSFGEVAIIHTSDYKKITSHQLSESIDSEDVVIYRVIQKSSEIISGSSDRTTNWELFEIVKDRPLSLLSLSSQLEKSKHKIYALQYSCDGQFIASINGSMPNLIFILDTRKLKISHVLAYHRKIRSIRWHPKKHILAICSGSNNFDLWTPFSCASCFPPFKDEFSITSAGWCSSRDCVVLNSRDRSSILYLAMFHSESGCNY